MSPAEEELEGATPVDGPDGTERGLELFAPRGTAGRIRSTFAGRDYGRVIRYTGTSVIAMVISEICLIALNAETHLNVTVTAVFANLAGTVPSYLLARYWIWSEADRSRPARQVALYWLTSIVSMAISSVATGAIAHEDHAHHMLRLLVLGAFYLAVSLALWVAKYVAYQTVIFRPGAPASADELTGH